MSPPAPAPTYADWKAPRADGAVLVWPDDLRPLPALNARLLTDAPARLLGVPLPELRARTRTYLGHGSDAPLIVTGHQVELHHPGVWVKNLVIHHLAARLSGRAMHLAVDTDQPKHLALRYPVDPDGVTPPASVPLTDDPAAGTADFTALLAAPTPAHALELERGFAAVAAGYGFTPAALDVLAELRLASLDPVPLPNALTATLHKLDWSLGLRYDAILASPLWSSEPFLLFAAHLLAHADRYAAAYNAALADYRTAEGITDPGRPMPDLRVTPDAVELPFWLDDLSAGTRSRPSATPTPDGWALTFAGQRFVARPDAGWDAATDLLWFCRRHNLRLSPRALTLTTFARLCFADLFLHGIGGGRYDQVTDRTLVSFFQLPEPPRFAVATGTLYFPWAAGRSRACTACVLHEGHRLKHTLLGPGKRAFLDAIAAAPRRSPARKHAFLEMQSRLKSRWTGPELAAWHDRLEQTRRAEQLDATVFDRELFYALQPKDRLERWIAQLNTHLS